MSTIGKLLGVTAVVVAAGVGYVAMGPYWTLKRLGAGITEHQPLVVAECVDFDKLRANVKRQLRVKLQALGSNPFMALAQNAVAGASDTMVDSFVTPEGLEKVLADANFFSSLAQPKANLPPELSKSLKNAKTSFKSLSEFSATIEPTSGVQVELLLERDGLRWKLVGIRPALSVD